MASYFRKVQASICLFLLSVLVIMPSLAQDDQATTVSMADGVPLDEVTAPAVPNGRVVYKSVDSKGNITFTDTAPIGRPSESIVVQSANTMPVGLPSASGQENTADKPVQVKYSMLVITNPTNDDLFGQDIESVTIAAQLEPNLQEGNTFQLYYDGQPVGNGAMSYTVTELERGTHTVEAKVFDGNRKLLKAASPVQFTVRRISALNKLTATQLSKGDTKPQPGTPIGGFGAPKGVGSSGGSNSAGDAGSSSGAGSSGGANSPKGSGLPIRNR